MIEPIDANQIRETLEKAAAQLPDPGIARVDNRTDASLQTDFAPLIENAVQPPQTDEQAVRQAKEMLASGQLDTPENYIEAASRIIDFGI
ncbi:MAG: hypothetical protein ACYS8Z_19820 [Planctomycetota bacterium]|jgi:hypothetical protein